MRKVAPLFLIASVLLAQQPAPTEQPPPATGRVSGMVIDVTTQEPLAKVAVNIQSAGPPNVDSFSGRTDDEGKFTIEKVKPGRYRLNLSRNEYVASDEGVPGSISRNGVLDVGPGQVIDDLVLGLEPAAVITGRVVDEDGDPFEGLVVEAVKFVYLNGSRELRVMRGGRTDDRGEYRIYGLQPGDYYLRVNTDILARMNGLGAALPAEVVSGYVDAYYPNGDDVSQASSMRITAKAETSGMDFRMTPIRTLSLSGRIIDGKTGRPGLGGQAFLLDRTKTGRQYSARIIMMRGPDGRFQVANVRPGSYRLEAMSYSADRSRSTALYDFDLTDQSLEDVVIRTLTTFKVAGRVVIEGEYDRDAARYPPTLSLEPAGAWSPIRGSYAQISDGDQLQFETVSTDSYRVRAGNLSELYLKSARYDGRDALTEAVRVEEGGGEFEIVLSANGAKLDGQIASDDEGVSGVQVVLIPDDRQRQDLFKSGATDQYGVFSLTAIAPGRYKVFAWEKIENGAWLDPNVVAEVENQGVRVEVKEGDAKRVTPKLIAAEK